MEKGKFIEDLGRVGALVMVNTADKNNLRAECEKIAHRLELLARAVVGIDLCREYSSAAIAWEISQAYANYGEWSKDDIKHVHCVLRETLAVLIEESEADEDLLCDAYKILATVAIAMLD